MAQYYIYSSRSDPQERKNPSRVLDASQKSTDVFVGTLDGSVLILEHEPTPTAKFDGADAWLKWIRNIDPKAELSIVLDSENEKVKNFDVVINFGFADLKQITFSSTVEAINFSFADEAEANNQPRIPVPGIDEDGDTLYCGINGTKSQLLHCSVKDLIVFTRQENLLKNLPSLVAELTVNLDPAQAKGERNALWFRPAPALKTTIRLKFKIDQVSELNSFLTSTLKGLKFNSANVVCRKTIIAGQTAAGRRAFDKSSIEFQLGCTLTPTSGNPTELVAGIQLNPKGLVLVLKFDSRGAIGGILAWLASLIPSDPSNPWKLDKEIEDIFDQKKSDGIFAATNIRRIQIGLDTRSGSLSIRSFSVDIEIGVTFGQSPNSQQRPVFLVTYSWSPSDYGLGSLRGQFWNSFDPSQDVYLNPYYEKWSSLRPLEDKPAKSIDLPSLIAGHTIENIPETIPTQLTRASITLTQTSFIFGATMSSIRPKSPVSAPQPYLGQVSLDAFYLWGKKAQFTLDVGICAGLRPGLNSKNQTQATLLGKISYNSAEKKWLLSAKLAGLYASTLYEFFDNASADHVMPLLDSIAIGSLSAEYEYTSAVGSIFDIKGNVFIGPVVLDLIFHNDSLKKEWNFKATAKARNEDKTLGSVLEGIVGEGELDIPDFLYNHKFGKTDALSVSVERKKIDDAASTFGFVAVLTLGGFQVLFVQYRHSAWPVKTPPKRLFKVALNALPVVQVPLVGDLTQPFDEMYYLWIQDRTEQNKSKKPGITRKEIALFNKIGGEKGQLVFQDKFKDKKDQDQVLVAAGSHFAIVIETSVGEKTCLIDYDFKAESHKKPEVVHIADLSSDEEEDDHDSAVVRMSEPDTSDTTPSSSGAQAPLKKKSGPLTLSNIGLKYVEKKLHIILDATFVLGPVGFSLLGFALEVQIRELIDPKTWDIQVRLDGLAASFEKSPLTIAGAIRHGTADGMEYYAGGLIIGFTPYQFQAAGFYGTVTPKGGDKPFKSIFVFAKLNGPLISLGYADVSGVTGGFGYNSNVRVPTVDKVTEFPFIKSETLEGAADALTALQRLIDPSSDGWFTPLNDTYWAAAGLKVDAFKMISIDAVLVVQFGSALKFGIFAVAVADIPNAQVSVKFAHVELGLAVVVDFEYGVLKVEGQLSPKSYVLHPDCHLTGGFGLYHWFDAPHTDRAQIGNFVFTIGGYHQAFEVPDAYPKPQRLGISWSIGSSISIAGQAYFAITPKVCMAGGRLHASFSAGPISAWFDAFADFLINYKPFSFKAMAKICVGVSFSIDILFIHTQISAEISAELELWGPPLAGRVYVNFWISSFTIPFGNQSIASENAISLKEFYDLLVLEAASKRKAITALSTADSTKGVQKPNEAHVFAAQRGLMPDGGPQDKPANEVWLVRGGIFVFGITCVVAVNTATLNDAVVSVKGEIYAKPLKTSNPLTSKITITHFQNGKQLKDSKWQLEPVVKPVASGLWGRYKPEEDPSGGKNNIGDLLNSKDGTISLMMGIDIAAPKAVRSPDPFPPFETTDASIEEITAGRVFPTVEPSKQEWQPAEPLTGPAQWKAVRDIWTAPPMGDGDRGRGDFVQKWASAFQWQADAMKKVAQMPARMATRFDDLFVAAPLLTVS